MVGIVVLVIGIVILVEVPYGAFISKNKALHIVIGERKGQLEWLYSEATSGKAVNGTSGR